MSERDQDLDALVVQIVLEDPAVGHVRRLAEMVKKARDQRDKYEDLWKAACQATSDLSTELVDLRAAVLDLIGSYGKFTGGSIDKLRRLRVMANGEVIVKRIEICGVVSASGPNREPLACAYRVGHEGPHSWSTLPTFTQTPTIECTRPDVCTCACGVDARKARHYHSNEYKDRIDAQKEADTLRSALVELLEALGYINNAEAITALDWWADDFEGYPTIQPGWIGNINDVVRLGDALWTAMKACGWEWT